MAEMFGSPLVQEGVSRGVFFVLGRREEKASQGELMECLEMAVNDMAYALERAQDVRIRHVAHLESRERIKHFYAEGIELLDRLKQQAVPAGQEEIPQGVKRKRWIIGAGNMSIMPSQRFQWRMRRGNNAGTIIGAGSMDVVQRFQWRADYANKFVRDLESGCSLHYYTFWSPINRHLLEGKTLFGFSEQGNLRRGFVIWPTYSDERGVEAMLGYWYQDSRRTEKCFLLALMLRLSESTDIFGVAIKGLKLLTSKLKLVAERAKGELTLLSNLQDIRHFYGPPCVDIQDLHIEYNHFYRQDPTCCNGSRHGLCANNNVSSELSDIFPEQVICWLFWCYYVPALEPSRSSSSSFGVAGRSNSRGGTKPPLRLITAVLPHYKHGVIQDNYALGDTGDGKMYRLASIQQQQVAEELKSDAFNRFSRQPELTQYDIFWSSKRGHGAALLMVEKESRRYNTRGSTRRSGRR